MDNSKNQDKPNHILTWCDIPVTDMDRAKSFYAETLNLNFIQQPMEEGEMEVFEASPEQVSGSLVKMAGYEPSETATIVYLNGGEDLETPLQRVAQFGGKILLPKTAINEGECGYFAHFLDSEGNRVGLYSIS